MALNRMFYVKVLPQHSIFCNLPTILCKQLSTKECVVVKLSSNQNTNKENNDFYVVWNGGSSADDHVEVPQNALAPMHTINSINCLMFEVTIIHNINVASDVMLKPLSSFDWDIISTQAGYIEENMLKEHAILYNGQVVQIRVGKNLSAKLHVQRITTNQEDNVIVARINNTTSLVVEPYKTPVKENYEGMKSSTGTISSCEEEIQKVLEHSEHEKFSHLQTLHVLPHAHYGIDTSFQLPTDNTTIDATTTEEVQLDDSYLDTFLDNSSLLSNNNNHSTEYMSSIYAPLHSIQSEQTSICMIHPLFYLRCFEQALGYKVNQTQWQLILANLQKSPSIACVERASLYKSTSRDTGNPLTAHAIVSIVMNIHIRPGCCVLPTSVRKGLLLYDYDPVRLYLVNSLLGGAVLPHNITLRRVQWNTKIAAVGNTVADSITTSTTTTTTTSTIDTTTTSSTTTTDSSTTSNETIIQVTESLYRSMQSCHRAGLPFILHHQQVVTVATPAPSSEGGLLESPEGIQFDSHDYLVELQTGNSTKRRGLPAHLVLPPSPTAAAIWAACMEGLTIHHQGPPSEDTTATSTITTASTISTTGTSPILNNTSNDCVTGIIDPVLLELLSSTYTSSDCAENRHCLQLKPSFRRQNIVNSPAKLADSLFRTTIRNVMKHILPVLLPTAVYDCLQHSNNRTSSNNNSNSSNNNSTSSSSSNNGNNSSNINSNSNSNNTIHLSCGSLLTGAAGTGRTTLLLDIGEFVHNNIHTQTCVQYINTAELRNKSIETILSKLTEVFTIVEQYPSNLILLDNLDILCPNSKESGVGSLRDEKTSIVALHLEMLLRKVHQKHSERLAQAGSLVTPLDSTTTTATTTPYIHEESIYQAVQHSVYILATAESYTNISPCFLNIHCLRTIHTIETLTERNKITALSSALSTFDVVVPEFTVVECDQLTAAMQGYRIYDIQTLSKCIYSTTLRQSLLQYMTNITETSIRTQHTTKLSVSIDNIIEAASQYISISNTNTTTATSNNIKTSNTSLTLSEIPGYVDEKRQIFDTLRTPLIYARLYQKCPIKLPRSVLLYGPSGCGKTLLAQAIGQTFNQGFISIRGPELLNKYIGASEKAIRELFQRAQDSGRACLIFFDEFESLAPRRGKDNTGVTDRIVNQLLTFIDGVESHMSSGSSGSSSSSSSSSNKSLPSTGNNNKEEEEEEMSSTGQIFIIAATSRPDLIDPALLRPGRIEKHIYIGLPKDHDRAAIVRDYISKLPASVTNNMVQELEEVIDSIVVHEKAEFFSPADWRAVVNTAYLDAVHEYIQQIPAQKQKQLSEQQGESHNTTSSTTSSGISNSTTTSSSTSSSTGSNSSSSSNSNNVCITRKQLLRAFHATKASLSGEDLTHLSSVYQRFNPKTPTMNTHITSSTSTSSMQIQKKQPLPPQIDNAKNNHLNDSDLKLAYC